MSSQVEEMEKIRMELHSELWPMLKPDDEIGPKVEWHLKGGTSKEETGLIYKGYWPTIGTVWKIDLILDLSTVEIYENITKPWNVNWVPRLGAYEILETGPNGSWTVCYNTSLIGFGVSDREFVNLHFDRLFDDGKIYGMIAAYPKEHPKVPKNTHRVRGQYLPSGTLGLPVPGDPTRCHYSFVNNFDAKGFLPRQITSMCTATFMVSYGKALIAECRKIRKELSKKN